MLALRPYEASLHIRHYGSKCKTATKHADPQAPRGPIWQRQNLDEAISRAPVGRGVEEFPPPGSAGVGVAGGEGQDGVTGMLGGEECVTGRCVQPTRLGGGVGRPGSASARAGGRGR